MSISTKIKDLIQDQIDEQEAKIDEIVGSEAARLSGPGVGGAGLENLSATGAGSPKRRGRPPNPGSGEPKPKKEGYTFKWTPEQKAEFERLSSIWFTDPTTLDPYIVKTFLEQIPMLRELAYNPPPGRSGPMIVLQAMKDIRELSMSVLEMLGKKKEAKTKSAKPKVGDTPASSS